jgi:uncharacterized membrane protein (UPF0182 family)
MDAVASGLIAGSSAAILIVFGGAVAYSSTIWEKFMTAPLIFAWLVLLSALTIGQLGTTIIILQKLSAAPSQAKDATVS